MVLSSGVVLLKLLLHILYHCKKKTIRLLCGVDSQTHCAPLALLHNILLLDDLCKFQILCIMYCVFNSSACIVLCNLFHRSNVTHAWAKYSST